MGPDPPENLRKSKQKVLGKRAWGQGLNLPSFQERPLDLVN